ncbi:MAG: ArnT family glycosyltransferase [Patescibacteria group bacterium]
MIKLLKQHWILILALVVGFALRFYRVELLPSILNRDEAGLAYNAYLLAETGQDEWGRVWPLALESFGDYKLPGYAWALIPLFKLFGLADWVVRLPSVIAGTLLILLSYCWFKSLKIKETFALVGAWLVALLPVSIFYSRMAYEANLALSLMVTALWLITLLSQKWSSRKFVWLLICLVLAIFTYNTPWLLLPFLLIYVYLLFPRKNSTQQKQTWWLILAMGIIFILGAKVFIPLTGQKSGITIFTDETVWSDWIAYREALDSRWLWLLGSKYVYWLGLIWTRFWQSFTPQFLVTNGDSHPWHSLTTWGHLTFLIYSLGWLGLVLTIKKLWQTGWQKSLLLQNLAPAARTELANLFLFIATLAPAVITVDAPHTTRSLLFFIFWVLWAVKGLAWLVEQKFWPSKTIFWLMLSLIIWVETLWHLQQLFIVYPQNQLTFQPGYAGMVQLIEKTAPNANIAVVDPDGYLYILTAWYLRISPEEYFATNVRQLPNQIGFRYGERVTHYHFIAQPADRAASEKVLLEWHGKGWKITGY